MCFNNFLKNLKSDFCIPALHKIPLSYTEVLQRKIVLLKTASYGCISIVTVLTLMYSRHYKYALTTAFRVFPKSPAVIIIEDDLEVSPDFFSYFRRMSELLFDKNENLFCISAWNDNGKDHRIISDPMLVHRTDFFGGLGWMLRRDVRWFELLCFLNNFNRFGKTNGPQNGPKHIGTIGSVSQSSAAAVNVSDRKYHEHPRSAKSVYLVVNFSISIYRKFTNCITGSIGIRSTSIR